MHRYLQLNLALQLTLFSVNTPKQLKTLFSSGNFSETLQLFSQFLEVQCEHLHIR